MTSSDEHLGGIYMCVCTRAHHASLPFWAFLAGSATRTLFPKSREHLRISRFSFNRIGTLVWCAAQPKHGKAAICSKYRCMYTICKIVCMFMCLPCVCVCGCACAHVCMCACVHVCMCACVHVCMCACVYLCMCVCVYVCMFVCVYVCMCVVMCVCVCVAFKHAFSYDFMI